MYSLFFESVFLFVTGIVVSTQNIQTVNIYVTCLVWEDSILLVWIYGHVTNVPSFRTLTVINAKENDSLMVSELLCYSIAIDEK